MEWMWKKEKKFPKRGTWEWLKCDIKGNFALNTVVNRFKVGSDCGLLCAPISKVGQIPNPSFTNVYKDTALLLPVKCMEFYLLQKKEGLRDLVEQTLDLKANKLSLRTASEWARALTQGARSDCAVLGMSKLSFHSLLSPLMNSLEKSHLAFPRGMMLLQLQMQFLSRYSTVKCFLLNMRPA